MANVCANLSCSLSLFSHWLVNDENQRSEINERLCEGRLSASRVFGLKGVRRVSVVDIIIILSLVQAQFNGCICIGGLTYATATMAEMYVECECVCAFDSQLKQTANTIPRVGSSEASVQ